MKYLNGSFREVEITIEEEEFIRRGEASLDVYIEELKEHMNNVPEEYRKGAKICFSGSSDYESEECNISIVVCYARHETHDERFKRLSENANNAIAYEDRQRQNEINQLRKLMSKYGKV